MQAYNEHHTPPIISYHETSVSDHGSLGRQRWSLDWWVMRLAL